MADDEEVMDNVHTDLPMGTVQTLPPQVEPDEEGYVGCDDQYRNYADVSHQPFVGDDDKSIIKESDQPVVNPEEESGKPQVQGASQSSTPQPRKAAPPPSSGS